MNIENDYNDRMNEVLNARILSGGALRPRKRRARASGSKTSRPKRRSGSKTRKVVRRRSSSKTRKVARRRSGSKTRKVARRRSGSKTRKVASRRKRGGVLLGAGSRRRTLKPARGRIGYAARPHGRRITRAGTMAGTMAGGRHNKRPLTEYQKFMKQELLKGHTMAEAARKWRGGARRPRVSGSKTSRPKRRAVRRNY